MKIVFFDIKNYEKSFFKDNILYEDAEITYYKEPLSSTNFLNSDVYNADIISVFTSSRLGKQILSKFKNLKLICSRSVGYRFRLL